jgi:putative ABC transport system ATP-binding protein
MDSIVQMAEVEKSYELGSSRARALGGVSLEIGRGEFVALAGPSGSGKTTLLNLAGALDRPSAGSVRIEGRELAGLGDKGLAELRNESIGFIFQSFNLVPALTVAENVELPLRLSRKWKGRRAEAADLAALIAAVGLEGFEGRFPRELSGGQRQRVAVARALAARPALVLADEPTANLDSATGAAVVELMKSLNAERGVTFLISTHDASVMAKARRLVRLVDGMVAEDSRPEGRGR